MPPFRHTSERLPNILFISVPCARLSLVSLAGLAAEARGFCLGCSTLQGLFCLQGLFRLAFPLQPDWRLWAEAQAYSLNYSQHTSLKLPLLSHIQGIWERAQECALVALFSSLLQPN